jgi:iron complex transport system substrate-binding protein
MRAGWSLLLLLTSCSAGPAIPRNSIVSNNACVDAILAEIAAPDQVGAVSLYSQSAGSATAPLAWAQEKRGIGSGSEEIIAARPRLALVGQFGNLDMLKRAGVPYIAFGVPSTVSESIAQVQQVAKAIGRDRQGAALAARITGASRPLLRSNAPRALIWMSGGFVPGAGTLQDELLRRAGLRNASAEFGIKQWDILPLETLLRSPPDIIFLPSNAQGEDARALSLRIALLNHLPRKPRMVGFPEKLLNCGGPSIIALVAYMKNAA